MKNLIAISAWMLMITSVMMGQTFVVDLDTVEEVTQTSSFTELVLHNTITNPSTTQNITLRWERVTNDYPSTWTGSQICDKNTCYAFGVSTQTFDLDTGEVSTFDVHLRNDSLTGDAFVLMRVYDIRDSANTVQDIYYYADINQSTGVSTYKGFSDIKIYPNPARDYVLIRREATDKIKRVEVYNMLGLKVAAQDIDPDNLTTRVDLVDLQKGIYMIRIFDHDNNVVMTKSISKVR